MRDVIARLVHIGADSGDPTFLARGNQPARLPVLPRVIVPSAIATLIVLSVISFGSAASSTGEAPAWSLGQRWSYAGTVDGPREDFTATVTVVELGENEARVRAVISYGFGTVVQDTVVALPSFRVVAFNASFPSGIRHRFEYDPPLEMFSFPLSAGKTWSSASNFTYSYRTLPLVRVSTPAGAFDAFPVIQDAMGIPFITLEFIVPGLGYAVMYYAADVGQIVRYEAFDLRNARVAEFSMTEFPSAPGPSRSQVGPGIGPALGMVAALLVGAAGASTVQILRTVGTATATGWRRLAEERPASRQRPRPWQERS